MRRPRWRLSRDWPTTSASRTGSAQALRQRRHQHGALELETLEPRAVFDGDVVSDLRLEQQNRAKQLIEDFMVAANGATARFLERQALPLGAAGPPLARALGADRRAGAALTARRCPPSRTRGRSRRSSRSGARRDPQRFPDLSLAVVKLLGRGEYAVESPGGGTSEHFGLAVRDYTHSTAPEPALPRSPDPAPGQGGAGRPAAPLHRRRPRRAGRALHRRRGRCRQGGAAGAQVGRRPAAAPAHRRDLRGARDRRVGQGDLGPPPAAAGRGAGRARVSGAGRRRSRDRSSWSTPTSSAASSTSPAAR